MLQSSTALRAPLLTRLAHTLLGLMFVLLLSASAPVAPDASAAKAPKLPPALNAVTFSATSDQLHVRGEGFTPGGRVQLVIVDTWGNALHEPVWTIAAPGAPFGGYGLYHGITGYGTPGEIVFVVQLDGSAIYGPNGSQDPASGYHAGADVGALHGSSSIRVRAFDQHSGTWSALATIDTETTSEVGRGL